MSKSREATLSEYVTEEKGLKNLLDDLCLKKEDDINLSIIKKALSGTYSDYGSEFALPNMLLVEDLNKAGYEDLTENAIEGEYEHNYGAQASAKHPSPEQADKLYQAQKQSFADTLNSFFAGLKMRSSPENDTKKEVVEKKDNKFSYKQ